MRKHKKIGIIMVMVVALGGLILFNSTEVTGAAKQSLTAAKVKKAPASFDDPAWQKATAVNVAF